MILERMKSEDDKKSQTGKSVNGEAMKQKLLSGIYTSEEVEGILNNMGLGYNADQASKKAKSLTENVKSVEFQDPRRLTTGNERLNDSQVGRIFLRLLEAQSFKEESLWLPSSRRISQSRYSWMK